MSTTAASESQQHTLATVPQSRVGMYAEYSSIQHASIAQQETVGAHVSMASPAGTTGMKKGCSKETCPCEHNGGLAGAVHDGTGRHRREKAGAAHAERVLAEEAVGMAGAAG